MRANTFPWHGPLGAGSGPVMLAATYHYACDGVNPLGGTLFGTG